MITSIDQTQRNARGSDMFRERALKFLLIATGLLCVAGLYPLVQSLRHWQRSDEIVPMFLSLYVTLGIFLLFAARNPPVHRSVIAFAAWSSFAHAAVMLAQAYNNVGSRPDLFGMSAILFAIGLPLIALLPAKRSVEPAGRAPCVGTASGPAGVLTVPTRRQSDRSR